MRSKAAVKGHPLHPMLVAIPIGLTVWTFVSDLVYLMSGKKRMWRDMSHWSGIAAVASGFVAAVPGYIDFFTVASKTRARNTGLTHMLINQVITALYIIGAVRSSRSKRRHRLGGDVIALHAAGTGLLAISGWLGGEMVYRHGIGMALSEEATGYDASADYDDATEYEDLDG